VTFWPIDTDINVDRLASSSIVTQPGEIGLGPAGNADDIRVAYLKENRYCHAACSNCYSMLTIVDVKLISTFSLLV